MEDPEAALYEEQRQIPASQKRMWRHKYARSTPERSLEPYAFSEVQEERKEPEAPGDGEAPRKRGKYGAGRVKDQDQGAAAAQ